MQIYEELINSLISELRRGTIILSVLSQLDTKEYGYSLIHKLEAKGMNIDSNTLYPLLRRLEKQGILESKWDHEEEKPRKYYTRTDLGNQIYNELFKQWKMMNQSIENMLGGRKDDEGK